MHYFVMQVGTQDLVSIHQEHDEAFAKSRSDKTLTVITRHELHKFADAQVLAEKATRLTGETWLPADDGPNRYPRFDVIQAPKLGDLVSRSFNGDSYPAGKIVQISSSFRRVKTDDGTVFYRVGNSASWRNNQTWWMISGHHHELNPSF